MKSFSITAFLVFSLLHIQSSFALEQDQLLGKWTALGSAKALVEDKSTLSSYYKKGEFIWHFTKDNKLNVIAPGGKDVIPYKVSGKYIVLNQSGFEGRMEVVQVTATDLIVINPLGKYAYYEKVQ